MGQLRAFLLFLSLIGLISLASCGTLNLNTTTTTTKAATPLPTTEPTFTAGSSTLKAAEPTVTIEAQTTKTTKTFPSSTTLTSTTSTTAKPLLILTTTTTSTTTSTTNTSSPAPWFIEEEKDFADDLLQAQAPIEAKLPTSGCKAAAFSSVLSAASAASSPAINRDGILAGPSSLPRREKIFVRVPSESCPPEITRKAIADLNNLRHCQGLAEMAHSEALAAEAGRWAAETATQGVVYKPGYSGAGQYATSTAAPYAVFSLDLSGFEVLGKWKGSGNNYLPWFTGSGTAPRHFTNDEWRRVREFGVGCAAYRFRTAKAMFWTVVFFRKA